jgi:hypothetical protein
MKALAIVLTLMLAGCATTAKFAEKVDANIGKTEAELVKAWGPPDSVHTVGESKWLSYLRARSGSVPSVPPIYTTSVVGNTVVSTPSGGIPGYTYSLTCKVDYEIKQGIVQSSRFEGNGCRSQ